MAKETDITTIRIPRDVKAELDKVALPKESYHVTISRLIKENTELRMVNNMLQSNINLMEQQKARDSFTNKLNGLDKENQLAYMVIYKVSSDIVPSEDERVETLIHNDFLTGLINEDKQDKIYKACELAKEQIKLGDSMFYNQLDIVDRYVEYVESQ
jgi:hypothetical protein